MEIKYCCCLNFYEVFVFLICFVSQLRMVALNVPMTGRMGSTKGIDELCWRQSLAANLTGKYRAFISNKLQHVYSIIHKEDRNLPVGNLQVVSISRSVSKFSLLVPIHFS